MGMALSFELRFYPVVKQFRMVKPHLTVSMPHPGGILSYRTRLKNATAFPMIRILYALSSET